MIQLRETCRLPARTQIITGMGNVWLRKRILLQDPQYYSSRKISAPSPSRDNGMSYIITKTDDSLNGKEKANKKR